MGIKNRLITLMSEKDTNPNELAQKIGVRPSTIYSILQRDSARIDIDLIMKISHALGITADDLLADELHREAAAFSPSVDPERDNLLRYYDSFNEAGRTELLKYARLLSDTGNFKRGKLDSSELA